MPASQAGRRGFESHRPLFRGRHRNPMPALRFGPRRRHFYPAMRAVTRVALAALCSGLSAAPASLWGQGQWVPPQPPCDLPAGHFKVTGGVLYLKNAAEKPNQRDQQLAQARKVLTEAIAQDHQEKNPAAWYYLGRYYFEVSDASGTDTAFARALALQPKCADDISGYRSQIWAKTVNGGLAAWQEGKEDSAVVLFHLAARLDPTNPKPFSALAGLYATKDNDDSALVYYRQAAAAAGSDTTFARGRKDTASNAWRLLRRTGPGHPPAQKNPPPPGRPDSPHPALPGGSPGLPQPVGSSPSPETRRTTPPPGDPRP